METDLNKRICAALADLDPRRVENTVGHGTPDINYLHGWIEDKQIAFPKRPTTIVKLEHYTPQQRAWHRKRRQAGGLCFVALEDSDSGTFYLLDAFKAAAHLGVDWTVEGIRRGAMLVQRPFDGRRFRKFILSCKQGVIPLTSERDMGADSCQNSDTSTKARRSLSS